MEDSILKDRYDINEYFSYIRSTKNQIRRLEDDILDAFIKVYDRLDFPDEAAIQQAYFDWEEKQGKGD